ncbi:PEP/pyruvate-binding domain-containing protein [Streptomyces caatingaensis]|uniref:PEP/pyruvate-binding domain-containing protein n=1 Tax=Streptomyces caatingaensis TaxID=1678637 RepID=UPI0019D6F432|nr:PEP/pyruvate-binding domain-containing protein [Streptomyces caatingaensis]
MYWLHCGAQPSASEVGHEAAVLSRLRSRCPVPRAVCGIAPSAVAHSADTLHGGELFLEYVRELARRDGRPAAVDVRAALVGPAPDSAASLARTPWVSQNIVGPDAAVAAVSECLAHHQSHQSPQRLAIVVQEFIEPDASVLMFSSAPERFEEEVALVKVSYGVGASLAGASDTYLVRRRDLNILVEWIAEKRWRVAANTVGFADELVPHLRRRPCLDEEQIRGLADIGVTAELLMGEPVQVELAWKEGIAYVLWCSSAPAAWPGSSPD